MDRRNFFKVVSTVSVGAATVACEKNKSDTLIPLLVPDREIVPGEEQWHPSVCTSCDAGCGIIVRVMRGERVIERSGQKFREPIATIKKIEGNPLDSVSGGRLCARGHAGLQSLYNPDRLRGPMRRSGDRGKAEFSAITWDEAIAEVSEKLAATHTKDPGKILFLTSAATGSRSKTIRAFVDAMGAPPPVASSLARFETERSASEKFFGWKGIPRYDLANARYTLSVGADFLGGWVSPVYYARQFGHFRQGRPGLRGKLVQAESRMSLTAASADEWLPVRPGYEPHFLIAVARLLHDQNLTRNTTSVAPRLHEQILAVNLSEMIEATGVSEKKLRRIARELGESEAPLVIGGASIVQTNSFDALIAAHYLNLILGNIGKAGGVLPPTNDSDPAPANASLPDVIKQAKVVLLDSDNPVYTYPRASGIAEAFSKMDAVISFSSFVDDSTAYADLILPVHHALESEMAVVPTVSGTSTAIATSEPFVQPLYNTRPIEQTLTEISRKLNVSFTPVSARSMVQAMLRQDETADAVFRQGGLWRDDSLATMEPKPMDYQLTLDAPECPGDRGRFPLVFQPYISPQFGDGRGANLPWMQELPDPASSAMWGLPVEIDAKTADKLNVRTGDWVRVESPHGSLEVQAYIHPAAVPGVISMAIGQGHLNYGRYASARGANPISILASGGPGVTAVRISRLDRRPAELIQFSPNDREQGPWGYR